MLRRISDTLLLMFFICAAFLLGAYMQYMADNQLYVTRAGQHGK